MTATHPAVSVVMPAYNAAKFIAPAIESALAQTVADREIIVVDDGSTDDTGAVVARFGDRVRYHRQANAGAAAARNAGIAMARAPWLAFLDSDDLWQPDHVEVLLREAEARPEARLVYGAKVAVDERGVPLPKSVRRHLPAGWIFSELFEESFIDTCSLVLLRTATCRELGGFDPHARFSVTQDYDLWLRLAAGHPVASTLDVRVTYRVHPTSLTRSSVPFVLGMLAALQTGERLLREDQVAPENHPERIDADARMRRAYREAAVQLFNEGHYGAAKQIGRDALRGRQLSAAVASRALVSLLPPPFVDRVRAAARRLRAR